MPTAKQDKDFLNSVVSDLLDDACAWIGDNLEPDDVFNEKKLKDWAAGLTPEEIFPVNELREWAESNGYTKE